MTPSPTHPVAPRPRSRRRLVAVATLTVLAALAPAVLDRAPADATEPCPSPQFAPDGGADRASACPEPPPPTTNPPGQPTTWVAPLTSYANDPSVAPALDAVTAERVWIAPGGDPAGQVTWSGPLNNGHAVQFDAQVPSAGTSVALRLREPGTNGSLCRTVPGPQPPSGRWLRLLTTGSTLVTAGELHQATKLASVPYPLPYGGTAKVTSTTITGLAADGVHLRMTGTIEMPVDGSGTGGTYRLDLTYDVVLAIAPDNGTSRFTDVGPPTLNALVASVPNPGTVTASWRTGPQPPNPDMVRAIIVHLTEPALRGAIGPRLTPLLNIGAIAPADQQWFIGQGFTLSMRNATMTPDGLVLQPALCRLDT